MNHLLTIGLLLISLSGWAQDRGGVDSLAEQTIALDSIAGDSLQQRWVRPGITSPLDSLVSGSSKVGKLRTVLSNPTARLDGLKPNQQSAAQDSITGKLNNVKDKFNQKQEINRGATLDNKLGYCSAGQ